MEFTLVIVVILICIVVFLSAQLRKKKLHISILEHTTLGQEGQLTEFKEKYAPIIDKDEAVKEREKLLDSIAIELAILNDKYKNGLVIFGGLQKEMELYKDSLEIGEFGLYERQFDYRTSEEFKQMIDLNYEEQKRLIKNDSAIVCTTEWTVEGSKVEGRKMTNKYRKLMLYAFNGECDSLIAKVKWNNVTKSKERITKAFDTINKLGESHRIDITRAFLQLKMDELHLTYEYELKKYEEKEEQRRIREEMREEEKAQRELEKAQREAEEEESRYQKALDKAKRDLGGASGVELVELNEKVAQLEIRLQEAHERKERAVSMAQLTKVGHIYVISNIGSFGEDVYKIGMTRRLDPLDRVKELGDASVPFQFDIHAIIYSENAPQLEYELHQQFKDRRLNRINYRKEFFRVTLEEIEVFVKKHADAEIQFTKLAEAQEYRETLTMLEKLNVTVEEEVETKFPAGLI